MNTWREKKKKIACLPTNPPLVHWTRPMTSPFHLSKPDEPTAKESARPSTVTWKHVTNKIVLRVNENSIFADFEQTALNRFISLSLFWVVVVFVFFGGRGGREGIFVWVVGGGGGGLLNFLGKEGLILREFVCRSFMFYELEKRYLWMHL